MTSPEVVVALVLRGFVVAATSYLAVLVLTRSLVGVVRSRPIMRVVDAATPRALRRLVAAATGIALGWPVVAHADDAVDAPVVMHRLPEPTTTTTVNVTTTTTSVAPTPTSPPANPQPSTTWTVHAGDNFWNIARRTVTTDRAVAPHWLELIDRNRGRLRVESNPDLIFPGQEFELPD